MQTKNFGAQDKMIKCPCCGKGDLSAGMYVVLEDIKRHFNNAPVTINSGCRCKAHYAEIYKDLPSNPPKKGDHLMDDDFIAVGADIKVKGQSPQEVYNYLDSCPYSNILALGLYSWGVHVGLRGYKARW